MFQDTRGRPPTERPYQQVRRPCHAPPPASCSLTPLPRIQALPDEVAPSLVASSHDEGPCAPQFSSPPYRRHRKSPQLLLSQVRVSSPSVHTAPPRHYPCARTDTMVVRSGDSLARASMGPQHGRPAMQGVTRKSSPVNPSFRPFRRCLPSLLHFFT